METLQIPDNILTSIDSTSALENNINMVDKIKDDELKN